MKYITKKSITTIAIFVMALTLIIPMQTQAARKVKLNKTKVVLTMTDKKAKPFVQLKVIGTSKKISWTTSNKTIATVSKKGKVTAKKKGTAVVSAKVNNRTYKCKVTVKDIHKHDYYKSSWYDPQCFLDGEVDYCCSICYNKYTEVIPALEHSFVKVSQGTEPLSGKTVVEYRCTKCKRSHKQYSGPLIDYKKFHLHCSCGMDFNSYYDFYIHNDLVMEAGGGHSNYNSLCCLV